MKKIVLREYEFNVIVLISRVIPFYGKSKLSMVNLFETGTLVLKSIKI